MLLNWGNLTADQVRELNAKVVEKALPLSKGQEKSDRLVIARHVRESLKKIFTHDYGEREDILPPMEPIRARLEDPRATPCEYSALLRSEWARDKVFTVWSDLDLTDPDAVTVAVNKLVNGVMLKCYGMRRATYELTITDPEWKRLKERFKSARKAKAEEVLGEKLFVKATANLKQYKKGELFKMGTVDVLDEYWRLAKSGGLAKNSAFKVQKHTRPGRLASIACGILLIFAKHSRKQPEPRRKFIGLDPVWKPYRPRKLRPSEPSGLSLDQIIQERTGKSLDGKGRQEYSAMAKLLRDIYLLKEKGQARRHRLFLGDGPHFKI